MPLSISPLKKVRLHYWKRTLLTVAMLFEIYFNTAPVVFLFLANPLCFFG